MIDGIQSDSARCSRRCARGTGGRSSASPRLLVASLLEELETLGLRDRTAIAFSTDHGESWGERFADKQDVKGIYHMHGATLYDEIVQVPLIVSAPGTARAGGRRLAGALGRPDADAARAGGPPGARDRRRVAAAARGGCEQGDRPALIVGTDSGALSQLAVRMPPWKLIRDSRAGARRRTASTSIRASSQPSRATRRPSCASSRRASSRARERRELSAEEEATVDARLADLGYL